MARDTCLYCGKRLHPALSDYGFCDAIQKKLYNEEKEFRLDTERETIKKEKPNHAPGIS